MGWFDSPDGTKFFKFVIFKIDYFGLACTKAGGTPLQGDRGGFDSLRVHKIQFSWASNSDGLEYLADTEEVGGSNPSLPTKQVKLS